MSALFFFPFNMSHPSAIQIPLQFDGHNYREWAFCAQTVLGGYGLASHLTSTAPVAAADNSNASTVTAWINDDGRVKTAKLLVPSHLS